MNTQRLKQNKHKVIIRVTHEYAVDVENANDDTAESMAIDQINLESDLRRSFTETEIVQRPGG